MFFRYEYKGTYIDVDRFNVNKELGKWLDDNNIPQSEFVNKFSQFTQLLLNCKFSIFV